MDARSQLGKNVRSAREGRGLSQVQLGAAAGLHRTEVSLVERGARDPRLSTVVRLARALDVPPAALLDGLS